MKLKKIFSKLNLKPFPNFQIICFICTLVFLSFLTFNYDNDFWFTINQGRYVLEHGFPHIAINSIHNLNFLYQSWGTGVLFYLIYNNLGLYGVISLMSIVGFLTIFFFYKLCFVISNNKRGSLIITLIATIFYLFYFVTRPHIFTILNLVIMLYLLESYLKTDNKKYLYFLPIISLLQINMHGIYFILLLIILSPYLINSFKFNLFNKIKSNGYHKKALFIIFGIMLITGFINPYGYKTIIYGFTSYQSNSLFNNTIIELKALNFHNLLDRVLIIIIIMTYVLHFSSLKKKELRHTLLLLGTSYLAFDALKSFYLFSFCSLFTLTNLDFFKKKNNENNFSKNYKRFHLGLTIVLCALIFLNISNPELPNTSKFIDYLDNHVENKEKMKLFTNYVDGSYAEYRGYYCYLDPRGEIFLKSNNNDEDIYEEYDNVDNVKMNYKQFIDKYKFDYMLVENDSTLGRLMKDDSYNYENVLEDDFHILYYKNKIGEEKKNEK